MPSSPAQLGFEIIGTGHYVPGPPVTNADLSRVMDTSDDWIFQRSGIRQRHFAPEGAGCSDFAVEASKRAFEAARITPDEIDYVVFATMTPEYVFPGSGALLAHKLGLQGTPALDIRQQCAAMLFGLQIIDGLIKSGAARTVLFVGAEANAGFMPWEDWDAMAPGSTRSASPEQREKANKHRALAILFGDGAGALVFRATDRDAGLRGLPRRLAAGETAADDAEPRRRRLSQLPPARVLRRRRSRAYRRASRYRGSCRCDTRGSRCRRVSSSR